MASKPSERIVPLSFAPSATISSTSVATGWVPLGYFGNGFGYVVLSGGNQATTITVSKASDTNGTSGTVVATYTNAASASTQAVFVDLTAPTLLDKTLTCWQIKATGPSTTATYTASISLIGTGPRYQPSQTFAATGTTFFP